jgi:hypothetical protein
MTRKNFKNIRTIVNVSRIKCSVHYGLSTLLADTHKLAIFRRIGVIYEKLCAKSLCRAKGLNFQVLFLHRIGVQF